MKVLLVASVAVLVCGAAAQAQQPYNDFSGDAPPAGWWEPTGLILQPLPTGSGRGIEVTAARGIRLLNQTNPSEISFDAVVPAGQGLRLTLDRMCAAGDWVVLLDTALTAAPQPQPHRIRVRAPEVGSCAFRWSTQAAGPIYISSPQVVTLDSAGIEQLRSDRRILAIAAAALDNRTLESAKSQLRESGQHLAENTPKLAHWATDARTVLALTDFADAVKARGDLTNPLSYDAFNRLRDTLKAFVPPVAQEHLNENVSPVETLFNTVKNAASGNILGLVSNFRQIGPSVRSLAGSIRDLLSTAVNRNTVRRTFHLDENGAESYLQSLYVRSSPLLRGLQTEADSFSAHMEQMASLQQRQAELIVRTEAQLGQALQYAGTPRTAEAIQTYRLAVNRSPGTSDSTVQAVRDSISARIQARTSSGVKLDAVNEEQRILSRILEGFASVSEERNQLDLDRLAFLDRQVSYLCTLPDPPGETNKATLEAFAQRTRLAAVAMRKAAYGFRVARFGRPPLGDRVLRECARAPELVRDEPAIASPQSVH